jgi:hypothetical protein
MTDDAEGEWVAPAAGYYQDKEVTLYVSKAGRVYFVRTFFDPEPDWREVGPPIGDERSRVRGHP